METLTDCKVPLKYHSKISPTVSFHPLNHVLGPFKRQVSSNRNREGCCTSHQVHSDIILQNLHKDDTLSKGDSWEAHNTGWYSQQEEQSQGQLDQGVRVCLPRLYTRHPNSRINLLQVISTSDASHCLSGHWNSRALDPRHWP